MYKKTLLILSLLISTLFLSGCATWEGVKEDSSKAWEVTKETSKEAYEDSKEAIHKATE